MIEPYAKVEILGVVASTPDENPAGNTWCYVDVFRPHLARVRFKVIGRGQQLEGFTSGDRLLVKGALRLGGSDGQTLVIDAVAAGTPPPALM